MRLLDKFYVRFFVSSGFAYAAYLKKKGVLYSQGDNCFISKAANIPDPHLVKLGDNVWLTSGCQLLCHDASVIMINIMRSGHRDRVGPIVIGCHSFLGNNVIVLPGTSIGSKTIIGAGSVVSKDVPDNAVWAGNPARHICDFEDYVLRIENDTRAYPWAELLKQHEKHVYDPLLEHQLRIERVKHFFGDQSDASES
ncbi:MAG: acyltransferase [Deltaproteobacteria bacterium]|jgi:acetyltransferase-like isoleucine patch superfamily enzyme|nr:acyltransferase [Deltaproteobacteria bacterium]